MVHDLSSNQNFPENNFGEEGQHDLHYLESSFPNLKGSFSPKLLYGLDIVNKGQAVFFFTFFTFFVVNTTFRQEGWQVGAVIKKPRLRFNKLN